jgi:3-hydroxybutyryl-CoA dehydrogenase
LEDRISVVSDPCYEAADVIIEASLEDISVKRQIIDAVQVSAPHTPFWSTTSSLPASELASDAFHPDRVIVAHFLNPAHLMPVVEVCPGPQTAPEVTRQCLEVLQAWEKRPILLRREIRGFVLNRLQYALLREALSLLDKDVISAEDLETVVTHGYGLRLPAIGPLGTVNLAGVGIYAEISDWLWPDLDNGVRSDVLHAAVEKEELFLGWNSEDVVEAGRRVRRELLDRFSRDGLGEPTDWVVKPSYG